MVTNQTRPPPKISPRTSIMAGIQKSKRPDEGGRSSFDVSTGSFAVSSAEEPPSSAGVPSFCTDDRLAAEWEIASRPARGY
jgi:hypothetical protein